MSSLIVAFLWTVALADNPCLATGGRDETVPRVEELRRPIPSGTRSFVPRFQRGFLLWGTRRLRQVPTSRFAALAAMICWS